MAARLPQNQRHLFRAHPTHVDVADLQDVVSAAQVALLKIKVTRHCSHWPVHDDDHDDNDDDEDDYNSNNNNNITRLSTDQVAPQNGTMMQPKLALW